MRLSIRKTADIADYIEEDWSLEAIYGDERSHSKSFSFSGNGEKTIWKISNYRN